MKLYRFKTFTTSYYFPRVTRNTSFLYGLYSPFGGLLSKLYWWLFKNVGLVRWLNRVDCCVLDFPYESIKEVDGSNSLMSFNMGSPGVEQKISILGWDRDNRMPFFAKFSQKPKAMELTNNEIVIYNLLSNTGLVPKLYNSVVEKDFAYIKTEYIKGSRPKTIELTEDILQKCLELSKYKLGDVEMDESGLRLSLSHGDFCPWNMLEYDGEIKLIDWELAADRPLGHDIFTYITQTTLLLNPDKEIKEIIALYEHHIKGYFKSLDIDDYLPYLNAFIVERCRYEISKGNHERARKLEDFIVHE